MSATDSTFGAGKVGIGSYNDSAYFDDVRIAATVKLEDKIAPVILLNGDSVQTFTVGETYAELGASANDNIDGDISEKIVIDASTVDTSKVGSYQVTYNVSDMAGNAALQVSRSVNVIDIVVADTTAPVITLVGDTSLTITVGSAYVEPGFTANDDIDGDITANVVADVSAIDSSVIGSYRVTYNVADAAGNAATEIVRTVTVIATPADNGDSNSSDTKITVGSYGPLGLLSISIGLLALRRKKANS